MLRNFCSWGLAAALGGAMFEHILLMNIGIFFISVGLVGHACKWMVENS